MIRPFLTSTLSRAVLLAPLSVASVFVTSGGAQQLPFAEVPSAVAGGAGRVRVTGNPGEAYAIWFSAIEDITEIMDGITLYINPIRALLYGLQIEGVFDNSGIAEFEYPIDTEWHGYRLSFQAVTLDEKLNIKVSNLARATFQKPNTFLEAVGVPPAFSIFGDLYTLPDKRILAIGGAGPLVQMYEPWTQITNPAGLINPAYLLSARAQLSDGRILVAGGLQFAVDTNVNPPAVSAAVTNEAYLYNPADGSYVATNGSMNAARAAAAAVRLNNGKVFIFGGLGAINLADPASLLTGILNSSEIYDPASGLFAAGASITEGKAFHTCTLLNNGQVLVAGGLATAFGLPFISNTGYTYNPTNNTFSIFPKTFNGARFLHSATKLADGKVILTGGMSADLSGLAEGGDLSSILFTPLGSVSYWDPTASFGAGAFKIGPILPAPRALHTATLMADGVRVLLAGGISGDVGLGGLLTGDLNNLILPPLVGTSEFISVTPLNSVVAGPDLVEPRAGASSAIVPMDGRILIFGGGPLAAELYQP